MVHWPSDPPVAIERVLDMRRGDPANISAMSMGSHTGTHMDAPLHFVQGGTSIDEMPLDVPVGRARVIEISDPWSIKPEELATHRLRRGERILFKTRNSGRAWGTEPFREDYVYVSLAAGRYLAGRGLRLIGIDYLSVAQFGDEAIDTHKTLLEAGVWIIEGLDLSGVQPGTHDLICLPLRIHEGDGAPARAIVRPIP